MVPAKKVGEYWDDAAGSEAKGAVLDKDGSGFAAFGVSAKEVSCRKGQTSKHETKCTR